MKMKISEFIEQLQKLQAEQGDLEVQTTVVNGERIDHRGPQIAYAKVLKGRERKPEFIRKGPFTDVDRIGEKVCRV